jgi:hypothetical protein
MVMRGDKVPTVGVREFREGLTRFLSSAEPVAVTRHGQIIGYYLPATDPEQLRADLSALKQAASRTEALLAALGITEEEIGDEFRAARRQSHQGSDS